MLWGGAGVPVRVFPNSPEVDCPWNVLDIAGGSGLLAALRIFDLPDAVPGEQRSRPGVRHSGGGAGNAVICAICQIFPYYKKEIA